jgi:AAA+ superfamily predicted ATPase
VIDSTELFEPTADFPDPVSADRYHALVGLDAVKGTLHTEARLLLDPDLLGQWSRRHHKQEIAALRYFAGRPPLFVFAGDVGTGKTALAETFGDPLSRELSVPIRLRKLSLNSRGSGRVGEMTQLISAAFAEVEQDARKMGSSKGPTGALVLLIDEADALAQSRELEHMHHEDRAGVNALIRGVDRIAGESLPVLVVACTNRLGALDPAVRRRAAHTFSFERPDPDQCVAVLTAAFEGIGLTAAQIRKLADELGPHSGRTFGVTYSDITQRYVPAAVLEAFPDGPLVYKNLVDLARSFVPTAPFSVGPA